MVFAKRVPWDETDCRLEPVLGGGRLRRVPSPGAGQRRLRWCACRGERLLEQVGVALLQTPNRDYVDRATQQPFQIQAQMDDIEDGGVEPELHEEVRIAALGVFPARRRTEQAD